MRTLNVQGAVLREHTAETARAMCNVKSTYFVHFVCTVHIQCAQYRCVARQCTLHVQRAPLSALKRTLHLHCAPVSAFLVYTARAQYICLYLQFKMHLYSAVHLHSVTVAII